MKKTLLTLSAVCLAVSAMAVAPEQMQTSNLRSFVNLSEIQPLESITVGHQPSIHKSPTHLNSEDDVITAPEGTKHDMTIIGNGYYVSWGSVYYYEGQYSPSNIIYGENNEIYIYDILPLTGLGTYTKGILNGDEVIIELPQTLYYDARQADGYNLTMLSYYEWQDTDENGNLLFDENGDPVMVITYVEDENPASLTFKINADGVWTTDDLSEDHLLGLALCSGKGWSGYGATDLSIVPFDDKLVEVPEDIEILENFWSYIVKDYGWPISFAQGDNECYFQGMFVNLPKSWIKANIEYTDETHAIISFPQNQYVGDYYGCYLYTKCVNFNDQTWTWTFMPDNYQYELIWDFEKNTMRANDSDVYFVFNGGLDEPYILDLYQGLALLHQDSFEGIPADPTNLKFESYEGKDSYDGFFFFNVPGVSTDGELILTDYLYYVIYVDGEECIFDADEYNIGESLIEIPWNFNSSYINNFGGSERIIDFFMEGISTIGIQSIYRYNGEETRSNIVTLNLDNNTDVNVIEANKEVVEVMYIDLAGRIVANPTNGVYIKRITYTDGTTISSKEIIR